MVIISYDFGHGTKGDIGAVGILNEEICIRQYGPVCINELMRQGHTLINCTPTDKSLSLQESLSYRTDHANKSGSFLHLCFHVNAFDGTAHGAEIEVASAAGSKYAQSILKEIEKLGFKDRGIKTPSLWVTKHTKMPCILIEPFFCDSKIDVALYEPNLLGRAIAEGVIKYV